MIFNNENIKHVAVYLRLSRDEENLGIEQILANHRQTLSSLCNENKWSYEIFEEVASSSNIINREQMVKLLDRVQQDYFDAVVAMDIDRLSSIPMILDLKTSGLLSITHPSIIDEATWNAANKIVNEYSFKAPRSKYRIYPTSNLIYCANCGRLQGCNYKPHIDKIYIKHCKCGNRGFYYNPVLALIKEEVLGYKESILEELETMEEGKQEDNTEYKKDKLVNQLNKSMKALENINFLFEEDEIDIVTYRERKAKRQDEIKLLTTL
ncbi:MULTISPECIES: recombinase family protein [Bacillaceae]|uniref:recombinase family protein n=1 Tax=Bacillaceae TaxID=186817 RepID=UPI00065FDD1E|nr:MULTISPECIES: recombinase family protein [Bacillaceae]MCF7623667.1 recombinase family protein [Peribacillus frigoritolerans]